MKIATFDVDCQRGFSPLCPNELPVKEGDQIVDELNAMAKLPGVVYRIGSKDCHPPKAFWTAETSDQILKPVSNGGPNVDVYWPAHCVVGTPGNCLLPGLPAVKDYDFFVFKGIEPDLHPYGACFHDIEEKLSTGVIEFLWERDITNVYIGGLATDYCVKTTAIQLMAAGFEVYVIELPSGLVDHGESPADAASRELLEETGYTSGLATSHYNNVFVKSAGLTDESVSYFRATNCKRKNKPEEGIAVKVTREPLMYLRTAITNGDKVSSDAYFVSKLFEEGAI